MRGMYLTQNELVELYSPWPEQMHLQHKSI